MTDGPIIIEGNEEKREIPMIPLVADYAIESTPLCYSDQLRLNNNFLPLVDPHIQLLELPSTNDHPTGISVIFLYDQQGEEQKTIGHVTLHWNNTNKKTAYLDINYAKTNNILNHISYIPASLLESIRKYGIKDALEVDNSLQGKGLGKLLWLTGMAHMRDLGFEEIVINGDLTSHIPSQSQSFYEKYGAIPAGNGREVVKTEVIDEYRDYLNLIYQST